MIERLLKRLGVVDVNANKSYTKFEPFILASQAGQVSFFCLILVLNIDVKVAISYQS